MPSIELPPTPFKQMDAQHVSSLIYEAMVDLNEFIKTRQIPTETLTIFAPQDGGGWGPEAMTRPNLNEAFFSTYNERTTLPSFLRLAEYLWQHGARKTTFSSDGSVPDKNSWVAHACTMVVAGPLWKLWEETSIRDFSLTKKSRPWRVPKKKMLQVASEVAAAECKQGFTLHILTPLVQTTLTGSTRFQIAPGIFLKPWTTDDYAWYWNKHGRLYASDDMFARMISKTYLQIDINENSLSEDLSNKESIVQAINILIAKIKFAISRRGQTGPFSELVTSVDTYADGKSFMPLRRQAPHRNFPRGVEIEHKNFADIRSAFKALNLATLNYPDLEGVLWMYDRATLAASARDSLLEATIGLERLLVNESGENTRRFRIYGTAISATSDPVEMEKNLKKIYGLRSDVAHGNSEKKNKQDEMSKFSQIAITYFSLILSNVVKLCNSGLLDSHRVTKLNATIEAYLNSKLYSGVRAEISKK